MILSGSCSAVFMANAGGAWDNAKKMIEDGLVRPARAPRRTRRRHRRHRRRSAEGHRRPGHQPAGQGDEHGRHAHADQRGAEVQHGRHPSSLKDAVAPDAKIGAIIVVVGLLLIVWAIWKSKKEIAEMLEVVGAVGRDACIASGHLAAPRSPAGGAAVRGRLGQSSIPTAGVRTGSP